jgi:hypothetical protein
MVTLKRVARLLFVVLGLGWLSSSFAAPSIATVVNLAGVMTAQNLQGQVRFLAQDSLVETGDTLATQEDSFARLKFTDGGEVTIKPESVFVVERYAFNQTNPANDAMEYNLIKGGMRAVTGLISKRGNQDAYQGKAVTATIGVRGTDYEARVCMSDCRGSEDGLYTQVYDGVIVTTNPYGAINVGSGQFGFASMTMTPILLTIEPNGLFVPLPKSSTLKDITVGSGMIGIADSESPQSCKIE